MNDIQKPSFIKRNLGLMVFAVNALLAFTAAVPAFAQEVGGAVQQAAQSSVGQLLQQGVLGIFVVIEGIVIWILYRQLQTAQDKFLQLALKQSELLAQHNVVLKSTEEALKKTETAIERVLDLVNEHVRFDRAERTGSGPVPRSRG